MIFIIKQLIFLDNGKMYLYQILILNKWVKNKTES